MNRIHITRTISVLSLDTRIWVQQPTALHQWCAIERAGIREIRDLGRLSMCKRPSNYWAILIMIMLAATPLCAADRSTSGASQSKAPVRAFAMHSASEAGSSYSLMIPYVTRENDRRTNIGLNNYSTRSMMKGDNPEADVSMVMYDR